MSPQDTPFDPALADSSQNSWTESTSTQTRTWDWYAGISLVLLVASVYWPTIRFDFVNWDDPWYVINNPLIRSWHPFNLFKIATESVVLNFAPITVSSFLVDHSLWGLWPGGYHLTNVLLHAVNAVLVYCLIGRLSQSKFVGWTAAALFAVHPVQIESVAWISSRKGLLSAAFILATLNCWLRANRTPKHELTGLCFFVLALLSKAIAVVVPAIILLYDVVINRQSFAKSLSRQFIPGFLSAWLLLITMSAQTTQLGGVRGHFGLSKAEVLAVDSVVLWRYVRMLILPTDLCVLYDPPTSGIAASVVASAIGWLLVAGAVIRWRKRYPIVALAVLTYFLFLLPVLNLFPITTLMNDRYLYLPSIPLFALAAAAAQGMLRQSRSYRDQATDNRRVSSRCQGLMWSTSMASVLILGSMTMRHLPVWKNGYTLWQHAMQHVPHLPVVQIQWANTLHDEGHNSEARAVLFNTLVTYGPDEADRLRILKKLEDWKE